MLWEAVLKQHPLLTTDHAGANEAIDGTVHEWINTQLPATRLLLSALSHLQRPAHLQPQIAPALEHVLLKALRLQLNSANKIVVGPGFESFTECFETLSPMSRERQRA
jgi:hypothetical protein